MTVLKVADLAFGYGPDALFRGVTFTLEPGQRASLVAPNGAGKTALLRLIAREMTPDAGTVVLRRDARIAFCRQSHELYAEGSVMDAFLSGFQAIVRLRQALTDAQHAAASGEQAALDRLARVTDEYHVAGGDDLERRIEMLAEHLGFARADLERPIASLSGGERGRLHLGTALAADADLLLLDEPTNHLDIETIGWLERHLMGVASAVLCVSHDRAFLDAVCPTTFELGRRSFRVYPLRYSDYAVAREEDLERERELAERQEAFIAKTEDFIRKNIAGQKTKQAQSRRRMLEKLETLDRPEDVWAVAERVAFRFAPAPRSGDIVLDARGLAAERGGRRLFEGLDLLVRRGERIGVVGPNGSGKTTLLNLLSGRGAPGDQGTVRRGTNLCDGYFDQHLGSVDPGKSAVEEIRSIRADLNVDVVRHYLARFRFWGDDPLRKVSGFSGGERSRLALAKLLLEPRNLLFLDEPTNHLDIPAAEILEDALVNFEGTVVLVSHDRRFLDRVTTRIVALHDGRAEVHQGSFADYQLVRAREANGEVRSGRSIDDEDDDAESPGNGAARGAKEANRPSRTVKRSASTNDVRRPAPPAASPSNDPEARRRAYEGERAAARALERKRRRVGELEGLIAEGEGELARMRDVLKQDHGGDWAKLATLAREEQALSAKVEAMIGEWTSLSEELASIGDSAGESA